MKIRKRGFLARSIDSVIQERNSAYSLNMFPSLKIFAFALPFLLFCFLFSLSLFSLSSKFLRGKRRKFLPRSPATSNVTLTMQMKNSPLFTGPRHFLTAPPDLNQTNHCPTRNKRVLHYFHGPYFPQHVEGPLSSPFLPPSLLFFFLSFLSLFPHPRGFFRVVHRAAPGYPLCAGFPFHGSRFFLRRVSSKIPIECLPREKSILSDN